jgi:cytochrome P450
MVAPCIYLTHRLPSVYPQPAQFRPERFLDSKPGTYTWIPFGGGPKRCLGAPFALAEMRTVLARVFERFDVTAADPADEAIKRHAVIFKPARGATATVRARAREERPLAGAAR